MLFLETQFRRFFTQLTENVSSHVLALQSENSLFGFQPIRVKAIESERKIF